MPANSPAPASEHRLTSMAAERNKSPIADVLKRVLPQSGLVLEISSGSGQHVVHFAREMPRLTWQPSERSEDALQSISAWMAEAQLLNIRPAVRLDVLEEPWPLDGIDAVLCLNMIHIAPWTAGEALIRGAGKLLGSGKPLILYGPFLRGGNHTAPSNEVFDHQLRAQNPSWGVRNLEDVAEFAAFHGFQAPDVFEMPANNLTVVFRKA